MWNFHRAGQLGPYLVIRMVMGILKCLLGRQQNGNTSSLETVNFKILALSTRGSACQGCVSALKVMAAKIVPWLIRQFTEPKHTACPSFRVRMSSYFMTFLPKNEELARDHNHVENHSSLAPTAHSLGPVFP